MTPTIRKTYLLQAASLVVMALAVWMVTLDLAIHNAPLVVLDGTLVAANAVLVWLQWRIRVKLRSLA